MQAEIMAIGTELLLGEILDSNSKDISSELYHLGIDVYHRSTIGDNKQRIISELELAFGRSDIVITTGGLGPTRDDLTKEAAGEFLGRKMIVDPETIKNLEEYFHPRGLVVNEGNKRQAYFPEGAYILKNENGTAPGLILSFDYRDKTRVLEREEGENNPGNKHLIIMPGPPREMRPMLENQVIPYLRKLTGKVFFSKTFSLAGIGEGHMEEKILDLIEQQSNPTIAPYAKEKGLTLRITASGASKEEALAAIGPVEEEIKKRLAPYIYAEVEIGLEQLIGNWLIEKNITLATAESCTGGLLSGRIIEVSGISAVFKEGYVTYSNEAKMRTLKVKEETLEKYGAVSPETAIEMARGAAEAAGAKIGLSVTGIAGPQGGTPEKPVGLVYIGISIEGKAESRKLFIKGTREYIRRRSVAEALNVLREQLIPMKG